MEALKQGEERLWRVQEVEWQRVGGEGLEEVKHELKNIGEKKLWKIKEDCDDMKLSGKAFVRGTERLWTKCLFEVQAKRIKEACAYYNLDPVHAMIKIWFKETKKDKKSELLIPSLQHQVGTPRKCRVVRMRKFGLLRSQVQYRFYQCIFVNHYHRVGPY